MNSFPVEIGESIVVVWGPGVPANMDDLKGEGLITATTTIFRNNEKSERAYKWQSAAFLDGATSVRSKSEDASRLGPGRGLYLINVPTAHYDKFYERYKHWTAEGVKAGEGGQGISVIFHEFDPLRGRVDYTYRTRLTPNHALHPTRAMRKA